MPQDPELVRGYRFVFVPPPRYKEDGTREPHIETVVELIDDVPDYPGATFMCQVVEIRTTTTKITREGD